MPAKVRMTRPTMKVLGAFLSELNTGLSGADIAKQTRLMSGSLYPILRRLEKQGWLSAKWEDIDPKEEGRPRRRLYRLKANAQPQAKQALIDRGFYGAPPTTARGSRPVTLGATSAYSSG